MYCTIFKVFNEAKLSTLRNPCLRSRTNSITILSLRAAVKHPVVKRLWDIKATAWTGSVATTRHDAIAKEVTDFTAS
jgi:hypothetical protein